MAGFEHEALVEIEAPACATLRLNRPQWNVLEKDLLDWSGKPFEGVDLLAGGVPCPPFSKAGKQLGKEDERNLFPKAINLVDEIRPKAVMLENVRGLLDAIFSTYREDVEKQLRKLGYTPGWRLLNASDFGVPQLRPRVLFVGIRNDLADDFKWPVPNQNQPPTIGELLGDLMGSNGWRGAEEWAKKANSIAPTLVGGSRKHGGPDLGPTRARAAWAALGVEGRTVADAVPGPDHEGMPRLTVQMAARVQGFPDEWEIFGRKTAAYRQIGNAFPPPVAAAVGMQILEAISKRRLHAVA